MTQEEKDLLLKDLCARIPYGVKCIVTKSRTEEGQKGDVGKIVNICLEGVGCIDTSSFFSEFGNFKPYLRPMSSMTEEELKEFIHHAGYEVEESVNGRHYEFYLKDYVGTLENPICNYDAVDWLNANNFDYRGLIPMGLANDATNLNIY